MWYQSKITNRYFTSIKNQIPLLQNKKCLFSLWFSINTTWKKLIINCHYKLVALAKMVSINFFFVLKKSSKAYMKMIYLRKRVKTFPFLLYFFFLKKNGF